MSALCWVVSYYNYSMVVEDGANCCVGVVSGD